MSGGLTTSFTSALSINELKRYLADAIETQNMVTFYEISKELVKRNQPCVIIDVLRIVLGSGFEFGYSIAFANTVRDVCYELCYDAPLFAEIMSRIEKHPSDENAFTGKVMNELYSREYYQYFSSATAEHIANMPANVWMMLYDRFSEISRRDREDPGCSEELVEKDRERVHSILIDHFNTQIDDIIKRDDLIQRMKYPIRKALKIDERKKEYEENRRRHSNNSN